MASLINIKHALTWFFFFFNKMDDYKLLFSPLHNFLVLTSYPRNGFIFLICLVSKLGMPFSTENIYPVDDHPNSNRTTFELLVEKAYKNIVDPRLTNKKSLILWLLEEKILETILVSCFIHVVIYRLFL